MDKDWILAFAFFMIFNNSPEVMEIISSENFDEDYNEAIKALEDIESEKLKELVINKAKENKEKMKAINEAYVYKKIDKQPTEEAIPKADYENRLKADMLAMLTEIQLEIKELSFDDEEPINITQEYMDEVKSWEYGIKDCIKVIQQKIDALKEQTDGMV